MARKVRIEYSGAVYHVMARGNEARPVFADDVDRERVLQTRRETVCRVPRRCGTAPGIASLGICFKGGTRRWWWTGRQAVISGWSARIFIEARRRTRLIRIGQEWLGKYAWSSYPLYLAARSRRPGWQVTSQLMGNFHRGLHTASLTGTLTRAHVAKLVGCPPAILFASAIRPDESEPR